MLINSPCAALLPSLPFFLQLGEGGITLSGGEPLLQPEFTAALLMEAHARGLTTCIDTTGQGTKHAHWDKVLPLLDYALFCIKSPIPGGCCAVLRTGSCMQRAARAFLLVSGWSVQQRLRHPTHPHTAPSCAALCCCPTVLPSEKYEWITKRKIGPALGFVEELEQRGIPYWLRYVLMPGKTDGPEDVAALLEFCRGKRSMQAIEVLPYHLLGLEVSAAARRSTAQCIAAKRWPEERLAGEGQCCGAIFTALSVQRWHRDRLPTCICTCHPAEVEIGGFGISAGRHAQAHCGSGGQLPAGPQCRRPQGAVQPARQDR